MAYKLVMYKREERNSNNNIDYVEKRLKNPGAARAILSDIEEVYDKLEYMADSLGYCNDYYLAERGYRKIILSSHNYLIIYRIEGDEVRISGVFHIREEYAQKL